MDRSEFDKRFNEILKRAMDFSEIARREGLLGLEERIDNNKASNRDIFDYGLRFVIDGIDAEVIEGLLKNIIKLEKDETEKTLKKMQLGALMSIQAGEITRILYERIYSYNDKYIPLEKSEFYKD
jgi:flagellar motor component MotA